MKLISFIEEICRYNGDKTALITNEGNADYKSLKTSIYKTACLLDESGIKAGAVIAMQVGNVSEYIHTLFACTLTGASFLPLDLRYSQYELEQIFGIVKPAICISSREDLDYGHYTKVIALKDYKELVASYPVIPGEKVCRNSSYDFLIQFTSGSSGIAKGVVHTEESMCCRVLNYTLSAGISDNDVLMCVLSATHSYVLGSCVLASLVKGAALILEESFVPVRVLRLIRENGVTVFHGVPFIYRTLLEAAENESLQSLRLAISASAPLNMELYHEFLNKYGMGIYQEYGSTETGPICLGSAVLSGEKLPVGRPISNVRVRIIDCNGEDLPVGQEGDIIVESGQLMKGYLTPKGIIDIALQEGWYATGDIGFFDAEGNLYATGRKNFVINIGGLKVHPDEVEKVLKQCPGISDAYITGMHSEDGEEYVKAFIASGDCCLTIQGIIAFCRDKLSAHKIPKEFELVGKIPRSSLGKVLKQELLKNKEAV